MLTKPSHAACFDQNKHERRAFMILLRRLLGIATSVMLGGTDFRETQLPADDTRHSTSMMKMVLEACLKPCSFWMLTDCMMF